MNHESLTNTVLVSLPMTFVEAVLAMRSALDEDVAAALQISLAVHIILTGLHSISRRPA